MMKKSLQFLLMLLTLSALSMHAATDYGFWVGGVKVTSDNASNITGSNIKSGKAVYDHSNRTLTLTNINIEREGSGNNGIHNQSNTGLTIVFASSGTLSSLRAETIRCDVKTTIQVNSGAKATLYSRQTTATGGFLTGQVCIGLDGADCIVQGEGTIDMSSSYDDAVRGYNGTENFTLQIKTAYITGYMGAFEKLSSVTINPYNTSARSTNVRLSSYYNSYSTVQNVKKFTLGTNMVFVTPAGTTFNESTGYLENSNFDVSKWSRGNMDYVISDENLTTVGNFKYRVSSGEAQVVAPTASGAAQSSLVIPGYVTIGGTAYPTSINNNLLAGNTKVKNVYIYYGCEDIGDHAFYKSAVETLEVPSSIKTMNGSYCLRSAENLKSLVWNLPAARVSLGHDLEELPSSMKLYVPMGEVTAYKTHQYWSRFKNNTTAGAYDFSTTYGAMTVTTAATTTAEGAMKVVYRPNNSTTSCVIGATQRINGRTYRITALGDSCFAGATSLSSVTFNSSWTGKLAAIPQSAFRNTTGLKSFPFQDTHTKNSALPIGHHAFNGSAISGTVNLIDDTYGREIGTMAFYDCPNLSELITTGTLPVHAFGGTTLHSGFVCYVPHYSLGYCRNEAQTTWTNNTNAYKYIYPYYMQKTLTSAIMSMPSSGTGAVPVVLPTTSAGSELKFYAVTGFTTKDGWTSFTTSSVRAGSSLAAGDAVLVTGIVPGKVYRMGVPSVSSVSPISGNKLVAAPYMTNSTVTPDANAYLYTWNTAQGTFQRQYNSFSVGYGGGYLKDTGLNSNTTYINADATMYKIKVNGNIFNQASTTYKGASGTVSYDAGSNTLTFDNATINASGITAVSTDIEGLTIRLLGNNVITVTNGNGYTGFWLTESDGVTFTGGGSLTLNQSASGASGNLMFMNTRKSTSMTTIKDCTFIGTPYADDYEEGLTVDNATVRGTGIDVGDEVILKNCYLAKPAGGTWSSGELKVNGQWYYGEFEILPTGNSYKQGDVNGDGEVDVNDVNILINIVLGNDDASKYGGRANVDGRGDVDVSDVNTLINLVLGK
ncbi:MAG: leucine-rich repeat protein [Muribaculaceae bacterium]|nr:leucine-rich repeat protein [Muribaculaceae bacterium]